MQLRQKDNVISTFPEVFTPFHRLKKRMITTTKRQRESCQRGKPRSWIPRLSCRCRTPRLHTRYTETKRSHWGKKLLSLASCKQCKQLLHCTSSGPTGIASSQRNLFYEARCCATFMFSLAHQCLLSTIVLEVSLCFLFCFLFLFFSLSTKQMPRGAAESPPLETGQ